MFENFIETWLLPITDKEFVCAVPYNDIVLGTDIGLKREENQDRIAAVRFLRSNSREKSFTCVAVCDGMGGMREGSACAAKALATFVRALYAERSLPPINRLKAATIAANTKVYEFAKGSGGTTLTAVLIEDNRLYSVNVGDSRIYVDVSKNGQRKIERASVDDSLEEAFGGKGRELVQFVGIGDGIVPHVQSLPTETYGVLITTDGVHSIGDDLLGKIFSGAPTSMQAVRRLSALARWLGGDDNASLVAIRPSQPSSSDAVIEGALGLWGVNGHVQLVPHKMNEEAEQKSSGQNSAKFEEEDVKIKEESLGKAPSKTKSRSQKKKGRSKKPSNGEQLQIEIDIPSDETGNVDC